MKSGWADRDAESCVAAGAAAGIDRDLALRIYTTRLLGRDPKLVLHGGGNTSLKTRLRDRFGEEADVLFVKSSGSDMAEIGVKGFVAVRLDPMRKLRALETIGDEDIVAIERANLIDPTAANPSVEMMLHAFLPDKFIDHTHATAVLGLIDQPDGEKKCREVFGRRLGFVPYVMPGFGLAKKAIAVFESGKPSDGLILSKHGIVTFGDSAQQAYERMIATVTLAEEFLARHRKIVTVAALPHNIAGEALVAPIVRGACSEKDAIVEGAWRRLVLEFRNSEPVRNFVDAGDLARVAQLGVITPDHTIRTKNWPLVLPMPENGKLDEFAHSTRDRAVQFVRRYHDYFSRHNARVGGIKHELDPLPRVVLVPGLGLFGLGRSKHAAIIAADIAEAWIQGVGDAEAVGKFESISESDMFDCEYWPLEQAKLGARQNVEKLWPLAGQIAAVTGAGGAIGAATAKAFAAAGAEVALLDLDFTAAAAQAEKLGPTALPVACD
ncbi:MAG TPA: bifunctional aldolase/short-chain dehydrogenase, partial [Xanthobacteraceae bacterium]|nr:bifunctional aldolase/short-chain dehydrogenase [Xanthobacteraceae bacterium]